MAKILIVDDEEMIRAILATFLSREGFETEQACDGQEGWEILQEIPIDLVVLDVRMPRMTGLELVEKIRADINLSNMPVIMLTTENRPEDHIAGYDTGADDYVAKPVEREIFVSRVRALLKRVA
jgi:two-component system response regulator ResD